jgi:2-amino-4-hydroxy-6-hydroxymethyldihydropteridine diphosphokinase
MTRAYVGLGANVGNRRENLRQALRWLPPECRVTAVSSLYRSPAMVLEGEPPGPEFLNAACEVDTSLNPGDLLAHLKQIEHAIGRRPAPRWSARPIDLDILLFGDVVLETPELTIPHPGIAQRAFVVLPLAEIAPEVVHPVLRRTIRQLADAVDADGVALVEHAGWAAS